MLNVLHLLKTHSHFNLSSSLTSSHFIHNPIPANNTPSKLTIYNKITPPFDLLSIHLSAKIDLQFGNQEIKHP